MNQNSHDIGDKKPAKLNPRQLRALDMIMNCKPLHEVANEVGVSRQTISEWKNKNPAFKAKLEELRAEAEAELAYSLPMHTIQMLSQLKTLASEGPHEGRLRAVQYFLDRFVPKEDGPSQVPGLNEDGAAVLRIWERRQRGLSVVSNRRGDLP